MTYHGLRLEVRRFCGAPLITAKGHVDGWQFETLRNLLHSFKWRGHDDLILDLTEMGIAGEEGSEAFTSALKTWYPEMNVHVVAAGDVARMLAGQHFSFRIHLCASLDEAAEYICKMHRMGELDMEDSVEHQAGNLPLAA
ncbi:MAG: hypothetical protein Q7N50_01080 [Armatimonadota bacterium]|nr:hypothetical protein [Armatimonadota bacterium]